MSETPGETISDLESSIIFQMEHYFGDYNLPRDQFLKNMLKEHDGWLPLKNLATFKRLANLTKDPVIIAKALKKSSGFLEVSEDNSKVRRRPDVPVKNMTTREIEKKTIYAKGYPKDTTFDDLVRHYKIYDFEHIMMRKFQREPLFRVFKGSVYIRFKTREEAEKFMKSGPHYYQGRQLKLLWQEQYLAAKYYDDDDL